MKSGISQVINEAVPEAGLVCHTFCLKVFQVREIIHATQTNDQVRLVVSGFAPGGHVDGMRAARRSPDGIDQTIASRVAGARLEWPFGHLLFARDSARRRPE